MGSIPVHEISSTVIKTVIFQNLIDDKKNSNSNRKEGITPMARPTVKDAELLLQLYTLRNDPLYRKASLWYINQFEAHSWEDKVRKYPAESEEEYYIQLTGNYWEMAATFVNQGLINEELFYQATTPNFPLIWTKMASWISQERISHGNPKLYSQLEALYIRHQKWLEKSRPKTNSKPAAAKTSKKR